MLDLTKDKFYIIYFDPVIFYDQSQIDYQAILHLIRRSNSKKAIINGLFDLIKNKNCIKVIKLIFSKLITDYKSLIKKDISNSTIKDETLEIKNKFYLQEKRNSIIKQSDISEELFKVFVYNKYNIEVIQIIELILFYISCVQREKIQVHVNLISNLISLIKKIPHKKQVITMIVQYQSIPDSFELAYFLLKEYSEYEEIYRKMIL